MKSILPKISKRSYHPNNCLDELKKVKKDLKLIRPYVVLTQYPLETVVEYYLEFLNKHISPSQAFELLNSIMTSDKKVKKLYDELSTFLPNSLLKYYSKSILRTSLAKEIIKEKTKISGPIHEFEFPAPKLGKKLVAINQRKNRKKYINEIKKSIEKQNKNIPAEFNKNTKTIILMEFLYRETHYLYVTYKACINHFIEVIAKHLVKKKKLKKVEDILNLTVDEVIKITKQNL